EFETFAQDTRSNNDEVFLPWYAGHFVHSKRYQWDTSGYAKIVAATMQTSITSLGASLSTRQHRKTLPPIARQLQRSEALAQFYHAHIAAACNNMYVSQTLLPFLWRSGDFGGRGFSVFLTRLPLSVLHEKLDRIAEAFPERKTFQEFRAPEWMVEAEWDALESAETIITPHAMLATLFPQKTKKLSWRSPLVTQNIDQR